MKNLKALCLVVMICFFCKAQEQPIAIVPLLQQGVHTFIKVKINNSDKSYVFLFDTRAGSSVASLSLADETKLIKSSEEVVLETAGGVSTVPISHDNMLHLEGLDINNINFYIDDISHITFQGEKLDGVIGYELLKDYVTLLNYEKNQLEFYPSNTKAFDTYNSVPFTLVEDLPTVSLSFTTTSGKTFAGNFYFDSGAGFSLSVNSSFAEKHNLLNEFDKKTKIPVMDASMSNSFENYMATLNQLTLLNYSFNDLPISVSMAKSGASSSEKIDGILGIDIIKRFNVVLDYKKTSLILFPNSHYSNPFNFNLTGLSLKQNKNEITVNYVTENSPASIAGFQKNDIIIGIDGMTCENTSDARKILNDSNKTFTVEIKRRDKKETLSLKPKRYY